MACVARVARVVMAPVARVAMASMFSVARVLCVVVAGMAFVVAVFVMAGVPTGSGSGVGVPVVHGSVLSQQFMVVISSCMPGRSATAVFHLNTPRGYMSRGCFHATSRTFHLSPSRDYTPATCEYWQP
ncbi:hypothetical protein CUREI_05190 [Corynebacterium ureicelerivorans]|uniref:Uncharacterized protein n=1 Tax=Corynebacterium ureicelerivorans TaxID=401472 RepID=A0A077HI77_9CORY|nr:hypothetical protein CUREI_05190 [Corynebacterium ureicelerivorans]